MSNTLKILGLTFLCLVWGINWVAIKISLEGFPPLIGAGSRFFLATIFLFFYIKWKRIPLRVNAREFRILLVSAFLLYVMDYGLIFWGEQYLSAGVTSIFFSTFALFTALLSNFVFKNEPFMWHKFMGLLVGLFGILVVFYDQLEITRFSLMVTLGSIAILIAAIGAATCTVIVKKYLSHMNHVTLSFYQLVMGTFFLVMLGLMAENIHQVRLTMRILTAMLYMGLMASAVAFVVYYKLLKQMSAISLSLIIYIIPLVTVLADFIVFKEVLPFRSLVGMAVIFSGIWLYQLDKTAPGRRHKK